MKPYLNLFYTLTGAFPYWVFSTTCLALTSYFCKKPVVYCLPTWLLVSFTVISLAVSPLAIEQFYKTGKWFWTELLEIKFTLKVHL
jgi:hypothetical protein